MYISRIARDGTIKDSSPCKDCTSVLLRLGIRKIVFTNSDGNLTRMDIRDYTAYGVSWGRRIYLDGK